MFPSSACDSSSRLRCLLSCSFVIVILIVIAIVSTAILTTGTIIVSARVDEIRRLKETRFNRTMGTRTVVYGVVSPAVSVSRRHQHRPVILSYTVSLSVSEEMHKFIAEQLNTSRVPLCINPQSAAFKSFAR